MGAIGFIVKHAGNSYVVTVEMGEIFARKRQRLLDAGRGELVPLPHVGGVDILWVDETVPFEISPISVDDDADIEAARLKWGLCRRRKRVSQEGLSAREPRRSGAS